MHATNARITAVAIAAHPAPLVRVHRALLVRVLPVPATTRSHPHRACPVRVHLAAPKLVPQVPAQVGPVRRLAHPVRALRVRQVLRAPVVPVRALRVRVVPVPHLA